MYQHKFYNDQSIDLPIGKIVAVGRNYPAHAAELSNPVPAQPLIFMKPATALIELAEPIVLPQWSMQCQHEVEVALLIGKKLTDGEQANASNAIIGYGLALDLTLRDIQQKLKEQGHPWELAKAFDRSCPISPFISSNEIGNSESLPFSLKVNGQLRQQGNINQMIFKIEELLTYISRYFTLLPGDIVLTGTPAGVADLCAGDQLELEMEGKYLFKTEVK